MQSAKILTMETAVFVDDPLALEKIIVPLSLQSLCHSRTYLNLIIPSM